MIEIVPSVLSADFRQLGRQVEEILAQGVGRIHVDVMDGHFVPNLSMGPHVVRCLAPIAREHDVALDVHLMVADPGRFLGGFIEAGASTVSVHVEASTDPARLIQQIRELGAQPGVAINPATPLSILDEILAEVAEVVVMTVSPGFAGQRLIPWTLEKITRLRAELARRGVGGVAIEADGGVHLETIAQVARAGADRAVAGSGVFAGPHRPQDNLRRLREAALEGISV